MIVTGQVAGESGWFADPAAVSSSTTPAFTPLTTPRLPAIGRTLPPLEPRALTESQIDAIRSAMKLFVEDDLARGSARSRRTYCDGCERPRPSAGFITYDRYVLCNNCAIEYEVARARGALSTPGQYVRDKHFGDGDLHALTH